MPPPPPARWARALSPAAPTAPPQRIWGEWQKQCLRVCDEEVKRYWICKEEQQMMAPFKCKPESDALKEALRDCGRDEVAFSVFRARRIDEMEAAIVRRRKELEGAKAAAAAAAGGGAR